MNLSRFVWFNKSKVYPKLAAVVGTMVVYILIFLWSYQSVGGALAPLALLPAMLAGWLLGILAGLLTAILMNFINFFLFSSLKVPAFNNEVVQAIPAIITVLLVGTMTGWLRSLLDRIKQQSRKLADEHVVLTKEITERRQVEKALQASEQKYRYLVKHAPTGIYVLDFGQGKFTEVNDAMCQYTGYSREELLRLSPLDILTEGSKKLYLERRRKLLAGEQVADTVEYQIKGKSGQESWVLLNTKYEYEQGKPVKATVVAHDITERKRMEEAVQESERRYRRIFENVQDVYYELAIDGTILDISPSIETLSKYSGEELIGKSVYDIYVRPGQRDETVEALQRTGVVNDYEVLLKDKDGQPVFCSFTAKLLRDENGMPYRTIGTLRDITERKRTEEALRQAHNELELRVQERTADLSEEITERKRVEKQIKASLKEKEVLLQEIHHRVKNNLQVISSLLNLQANYIKDQQVLDILQDSQNRVRSMALIHEKLYQSPDLAWIDIAEYIQNLVAYLIRSYRVDTRKINLDIKIDNIFFGVDTAVPCGLILNELVSNSLKYAFPGGQTGDIYIELSANNRKQLTLRIGDNGIGLPSDMDFEHTTSLGLQLVNTLVDQLDGTITLNNTRGTEFQIIFTMP